MSLEKRKLALTAHLDSVTGCGDELVFHVHGHRKKKTGNYEHFDLELRACRFAATRILRELRDMHVRDRERLAQEQGRIEREVATLTERPTT